MTPLGRSTLVTAVAVAIAGLVLGWPALVAFGTATTLACLLSLAVLVRRPDLVIERRIVPTTVPRGEPVIAHLTVRNRAPYRFRGGAAFQQVGPDISSVDLPTLAPFDRTLMATRLPSDRRGRHEVSPVLQRRFDPFGFVTAEQPHARAEEVIVLPRDLGFARLGAALMQDLDGSTDDSDPRGSMVFHQLREYVPGDDVRRIHWKATARQANSGTLIVRQDVDVAKPSTTVVVDLRPDRYSAESFELALDAAASAISSAQRSASPVILQLSDGMRYDSRSDDTRSPLIALALVGPSTSGSLRQELASLRRGRGGATLVLVTGVSDDDGDAVAASRLRGLYRRIIVISVTPDVRPARRFAGVTAIQGRTAEELVRGWEVAVSR